jgi:hypothetical protein
MQNGDSFELKGTIRSLGSWNRPVTMLTDSAMTSFPRQFPKHEIDPKYVALDFEMDDVEQSHCHLLVEREEVKRLNLTVGDRISIKVAPEK